MLRVKRRSINNYSKTARIDDDCPRQKGKNGHPMYEL